MGFTKAQRERYAALYNAALQTEEASKGGQARLRQLLDDMIAVLLEAGLATEKYMHAKSIVPHIDNRGRSKMRWQKIFEKGAKIISVGVSIKECGPNRAIAFYEGPTRKVHGPEFIELCKTSPHYARYDDPDIVEAGSVGCGHWNQFLACVIDKVPVPAKYQKLLCEPGNPCLDPQRLGRDQPDLQKLLKDGIKFTMIQHSVEKEFPRSPHLFQKALNIEHHIAEGLIDAFSS